MKRAHKPPDPLRDAAEQRLAQEAPDPDHLSHDLRVHQIELEMQNETMRQTQLDLEVSRDRYHWLYDFAPVGYLTLAETGPIVEANLTAARLLGVERRRLLGDRFERFLAADECDRWWHILRSALRQREGRREELHLLAADGREFAAVVDCQYPSAQEATGEVLVTLTDISEIRRVEARLAASEQRYLALFRDASDAIAIADGDGRLEEVNRRFAALLGYGVDELRGMTIDRIHPTEELPRIRAHFDAIVRQGASWSLETLVRCKDGGVVGVEIRPTRIELGGRIVAQGVFIDLTERVRHERQRLDEERTHRDALIREVHHRIKNNLQSVAGLLRRELGRFIELDPRLEAAITQINAIAAVYGLQGADPAEAVRLCDTVREVCASVASMMRRPIAFAMENEQNGFLPVRLAASEAVSVALVLNELVLNAVKHSPAGSPDPSVRLCASRETARIEIRNAVAAAPTFDLASGAGLGTGLQLVRSLLPEHGARLGWAPCTNGVLRTILEMEAPVLTDRVEGRNSA